MGLVPEKLTIAGRRFGVLIDRDDDRLDVDAIRRLFGVDIARDHTGNLPSPSGIFPDYPAPIVHNGDDGRELVLARWGMPSSQKAPMDATGKRAQKLEAKDQPVDFKERLRPEPDGGTTGIRNVSSARWK